MLNCTFKEITYVFCCFEAASDLSKANSGLSESNTEETTSDQIKGNSAFIGEPTYGLRKCIFASDKPNFGLLEVISTSVEPTFCPSKDNSASVELSSDPDEDSSTTSERTFFLKCLKLFQCSHSVNLLVLILFICISVIFSLLCYDLYFKKIYSNSEALKRFRMFHL